MEYLDENTDVFYKTEPTGNGRYPTQLEWWKFLEQVKEMRSVQKEQKSLFDFDTLEEHELWADETYSLQCALEFRVDNMIKEFLR